MKKLPYMAAFLVGVNALLSQVMIIRELLVNFSGNELSMGIIIATWLVGAAIGSLVLGRYFIEKIKTPTYTFSILLLVISALIPISIFLSKTVRYMFQIPIYETLGPLHMLSICAILLLPLSGLLSFCFILSCKMLKIAVSKNNTPGTTYMLEALGATAAGAVFTFLLIIYFNHFQIALGLIFINILFASYIACRKKFFLYLLLSIFIAVFSANSIKWLQKISETLQWHPYEVVYYASSPYGNISVTKSADTFNVYENGALLFTTQDEVFNENFSHLVMLQHSAPKNVLLLGNGIGGILRQILKHNPQSLTYLQLDSEILRASKKFLPQKEKNILSDPRLKIIHEDAGFFIKRTKERFDLIIINMPDPVTLSINRFYTKEFYEIARSHLKKGGILATRISSKESIISNELARYNASAYNTLKNVFHYVECIPGENLIFIASDDLNITTDRPEILVERFSKRAIKTDFLTEYHIRDRYYPDMLNYLAGQLEKGRRDAGINTDFHPICFYYGFILWNIKFQPHIAGLFNSIVQINILGIICIMILFFLWGLFAIRFKKDSAVYFIRSAIAVSGAAGITLEIIILLSFQISYGYVYSKVGFLIALFMLGLASGSYIINQRLYKFKNLHNLLCGIILIFCLYITLAPLIIRFAASIPLQASEYIFYLMILITGMFTGCQFPVAVALLQKRYSPSYSASIIWGSDLLGAATGVLISSLIIIPVLGMFTACFIAATFCAISLILLLFRQRLQR